MAGAVDDSTINIVVVIIIIIIIIIITSIYQIWQLGDRGRCAWPACPVPYLTVQWLAMILAAFEVLPSTHSAVEPHDVLWQMSDNNELWPYSHCYYYYVFSTLGSKDPEG